LYNKQVNLFHCGKYARRKICEIGFNAGHSALLMLLMRDMTPTDFLIFDIGEHKYMRPAFEYLNSVFPHVRFTLVVGDSTKTIPQWITNHPEEVGTYDVVHVDGGHSFDCITNDSRNSLQLAGHGSLLIYDDVYIGYINNVVDQVIATNQCREWALSLPTEGYTHRVVIKQ
jgi:predicted O-methyltransferase YrrM